jgi:hypothetical protein
MTLNPTILNAALEGLELEKQRLEASIAEVRALLGGRAAAPVKSTPYAQSHGQPRKRVFSAATRKKMAEAQRRRWASARDASAPAPAAKKSASKTGAKKAAKKAAGSSTKATAAPAEE